MQKICNHRKTIMKSFSIGKSPSKQLAIAVLFFTLWLVSLYVFHKVQRYNSKTISIIVSDGTKDPPSRVANATQICLFVPYTSASLSVPARQQLESMASSSASQVSTILIHQLSKLQSRKNVYLYKTRGVLAHITDQICADFFKSPSTSPPCVKLYSKITRNPVKALQNIAPIIPALMPEYAHDCPRWALVNDFEKYSHERFESWFSANQNYMKDFDKIRITESGMGVDVIYNLKDAKSRRDFWSASSCTSDLAAFSLGIYSGRCWTESSTSAYGVL